MGWTSPRTWVSDEVPSATDFNTHIRDNLNYLHSGQPAQAVHRLGTADYSTSGTAFADVDGTNLKLDVTTSTGRLRIDFQGMFYGNSSTRVIKLDFAIDGARVGDAANGLIEFVADQVSPKVNPRSMTWLATGLSVGSHEIKVQWATDAATAYLANNARYVCLEVQEA